MSAHECQVEKGLAAGGTIHLPGTVEVGGRHLGGGGCGWVIPYCATDPLTGVQECCTLMRFWLCPCCWWAHCPWWCHTGDRRERSRLGTRESKRSAKTIRSVFERQLSRGGRKSIGIYMLYFLRSFQRTKCTTCSDPFRHQNAQTDQNSLAVKAAKYMKEISLL